MREHEVSKTYTLSIYSVYTTVNVQAQKNVNRSTVEIKLHGIF